MKVPVEIARALDAEGELPVSLRHRMRAEIPANGVNEEGARHASAEAFALRSRGLLGKATSPREAHGGFGPDDVSWRPPARGPSPGAGPPGAGEREPREFDLESFDVTVVAGTTTEALRRLTSLVRTFRNADFFEADTRAVGPDALRDALTTRRGEGTPRRSWLRPSRRSPHDATPTDLRAALAAVAAELETTPLLVLTDGRVTLPAERPPFRTVVAMFGTSGRVLPAWARAVRVGLVTAR